MSSPTPDSNPKLRKHSLKREIDRLRVRIAMRVLMVTLNVENAKALSRALAPKLAATPEKMESFERTCRRHVSGEVLPKESLFTTMQSNGYDHLVSILKNCLNSAAWEILKEREVARLTMLEAMHGSPSGIGAILFEPGEVGHLFESRLREYDENVANGVEALTGFDAIETYILLAAYARSIQSEAFTNAVTFSFMDRRPALSEDPVLCEDFRALFTAIDRHMVIWVSSSTARKMDMHVPWQGQMPDKVIPDPNQPPSLVELAELALNWEGKNAPR